MTSWHFEKHWRRDKHILCVFLFIYLFHVSHRAAKTIHPSRQKCFLIYKKKRLLTKHVQPAGRVHAEEDGVQREAYSQ